jgi:hypothetical protein
MTIVLRLAGVYNLLWGAWAVLLPHQFWALLDMEQPNYPFLWQCIGMIVGVYGIGYWIAASDVARHWPIVLVGLLGKIFGPIGFVDAHFVRDLVPLRFGVTLLTNDLVWWVPFGLMLRHAYRVNEAARSAMLVEDAPRQPDGLLAALESATTQQGRTLAAMSRERPVLVVLLRHLGCTFCREALADVAARRAEIERSATICLVHMTDDASAAGLFAKHALGDVARVADADKRLYGALELARGTIGQLFGPRLWVRGLVAGVLGGHGIGGLRGDGFQMSGAFLIRDGRVVRAFRHQDAGDRPDYCAIAA